MYLIRLTSVLLITTLLFVSCSKRVGITAHRGASGNFPENTLLAMKKAIEKGADYSELDVQESSDGILVLYHDKNLQRTSGINRNMWEMPYDSLLKLEAGNWLNPNFKGEPIPRLIDVINLVRGKMKLNIEIKMNGHQKQLTEKVVQMVEENNFISDCILTSFDLDEIDKVKSLNKEIKVGYILGRMPKDRDIYSSDIDLLSVSGKLINKDFIEKAQKHNLEVHVWTINKKENMRKLIDLGVDNIITDYPSLLQDVINKI